MAAAQPTVVRMDAWRAIWVQAGLLMLLWLCGIAFWWLEDWDVPVLPEIVLIVGLVIGWLLIVCLAECIRATRFGYLLKADEQGLHIAGGTVLPWSDLEACHVGSRGGWRFLSLSVWFKTRPDWKPPWKDSRFGPQLTQDAQSSFSWTSFLGRADAQRLRTELEQWGRLRARKFQVGWQGPKG